MGKPMPTPGANWVVAKATERGRPRTKLHTRPDGGLPSDYGVAGIVGRGIFMSPAAQQVT